MAEIQYIEALTLDDFQTFTESSRRDSDDPATWGAKLPELIQSEGLEFLTQHGNGSLLLLPPEFGLDTTAQAHDPLKSSMADELSDNLWFGFAAATYLGKSATELVTRSLGQYTEELVDSVVTFSDWQAALIAHAPNMRVLTKWGMLQTDAPENIRYTTLRDNAQYLFVRMHHRLTRALSGGANDMSPPTATELEPIADPELATGDFLNILGFIAVTKLGWDVEDVARFNAHKLFHRVKFGKIATP